MSFSWRRPTRSTWLGMASPPLRLTRSGATIRCSPQQEGASGHLADAWALRQRSAAHGCRRAGGGPEPPAADHWLGQHNSGVDQVAQIDGMGPMDERELAEALDAGKNDLDDWGDPQRPEPDAPLTRAKPKSEKRQRGVVVSVRLTPDELAEIQRQADAVSQTVSGYLRQLATTRPRPSARSSSTSYPPPPTPAEQGRTTAFVHLGASSSSAVGYGERSITVGQ